VVEVAAVEDMVDTGHRAFKNKFILGLTDIEHVTMCSIKNLRETRVISIYPHAYQLKRKFHKNITLRSVRSTMFCALYSTTPLLIDVLISTTHKHMFIDIRLPTEKQAP
jgi:hypothetical protein